MQNVNGIGGVFILSDDPAKLARWYERNLGIRSVENQEDGTFYCEFLYRHLENPEQKLRTVWAILRGQGKRGAAPQFQVNYRVDDLEAVLRHLKEHGVTIEKVEEYDYGRFAWIEDCDGNRIELFEEKESL